MNKNEITPVQIAIRIVIIIILIVVLILVSFAMVRLVPKVFTGLSNLRSFFAGLFPSGESMHASLDKSTVSIGEDSTLTFNRTGGKAEGIYTLSYSCSKISSTTHLKVAQGTTDQVVNCDTPLYIGEANATTTIKNLTVTPVGNPISYEQPMAISINHVTGSTTVSSAAVTLTIKGQPVLAAATSTPAASSATTTTKVNVAKSSGVRTIAPSPSYYSSAPANLNFVITAATINRGIDQGAITFNVTNVGGQPSGAWRFNAILPRYAGQVVFDSPYQSSIPPGGTSIMTLSFDNAASGPLVITLYGFGDQQTFNFQTGL